MEKGYSEIVVLKPTTVFLSFLSSQVPQHALPHMRLLQKDTTAYVLQKPTQESNPLDVLEKHAPAMFRHEICRWLGEGARNEIETSFFDFMCCFQLELHSHLIVLEPSIQEGRQMLLLKPQMALVHWLRALVEEDEELSTVVEHLSLAHLVENSSALVKNFTDISAIRPFVASHFKSIFKAAMQRISPNPDDYPEITSYAAFCSYFSTEIHTQLIHLGC